MITPKVFFFILGFYCFLALIQNSTFFINMLDSILKDPRLNSKEAFSIILLPPNSTNSPFLFDYLGISYYLFFFLNISPIFFIFFCIVSKSCHSCAMAISFKNCHFSVKIIRQKEEGYYRRELRISITVSIKRVNCI